jgi:hypothetical protein
MNDDKTAQIRRLRSTARRAYLQHERAGADLSCGSALAAHIRPRVAGAAKTYNDAMHALKAIDPEFPYDAFNPLPE